MADKNESCGGGRENCPMVDAATIEEIAEKAADRAIEKMTAHVYQEIGRGIVTKIFYLAGIVVVGAAFWLASKGVIKP